MEKLKLDAAESWKAFRNPVLMGEKWGRKGMHGSEEKGA